MAHPSDVREVLQYIPQFRGKVFLVLVVAGLLPEPAVAETLLVKGILIDDVRAIRRPSSPQHARSIQQPAYAIGNHQTATWSALGGMAGD
jgi:hypothetical protein